MTLCSRCETTLIDLFEDQFKSFGPRYARCLLCGYPLDLNLLMTRIKMNLDKITQTVRVKREKDGIQWNTMEPKDLVKVVEEKSKKDLLLPEYNSQEVAVLVDQDSNYFVFNFGRYRKLGHIIRYVSKKESLAKEIKDPIYGGFHLSLSELRKRIGTGCPPFFDILLPYISSHNCSPCSKVSIASISDKIESHLQTCGFCARIASVGKSIQTN